MVLLQSREINYKTRCTKEPRNRSNPSEHSAGADLQPLPLDRASPPLLGAHDVSDQHEAIAAAVAAVSEMVDERRCRPRPPIGRSATGRSSADGVALSGSNGWPSSLTS